MAPNLLVAAQRLVLPHRWFTHKKHDKEDEYRVEQWESPVPGTYEYNPGRGWALIATGRPAQKLSQPVAVKYSRVLRRNFLIHDYDNRRRFGDIVDEDGSVRKVGFFRLDDGVAYVNFLDEDGTFIPGPYKLWCIDMCTGKFREMLKGDDPSRQSRNGSRAASIAASGRSASSTRRSSITSAARATGDLGKSTPFGKSSASRASSIAHIPVSQTSTRTSGAFDDFRSPRGSFKNLTPSETITTAPTSPSSSIRYPLDDLPMSNTSTPKQPS